MCSVGQFHLCIIQPDPDYVISLHVVGTLASFVDILKSGQLRCEIDCPPEAVMSCTAWRVAYLARSG